MGVAVTLPHTNQKNVTLYSYSTQDGLARICTQLASGAFGLQAIPVDKQMYEYFEVVSRDVAKHVVASGMLLPDNKNTQAQNVHTATMLALLKLHAEGVPVVATLQEGRVYENWVVTSIANQMMEHMHLSDALVLSVNGVKGHSTSTWRTTIATQELAKAGAGVPTP